MQREEALAELAGLIELEDAEARRREVDLRQGKSGRMLEEEGVLARRLSVAEERPAMFGRTAVDFAEDASRPGSLARFAVRPGSVVRVLDSDDEEPPTGIVTRAGRGRVEVVFDGAPDFGHAAVDLTLAADQVTAGRLREGLARAAGLRGRSALLIDIVLGVRGPDPVNVSQPLAALDEALNEDQRQAASVAVLAPHVGLIHGPPGTGKTRVLVEVVRQCVERGERVLCLTASNAAVDHLAIALLARDPALPLARTGHPARVHPELEAHTLAALTAAHPQRQLGRQLVEEAHRSLRDAHKRSDRSRAGREAMREAKREVGRMFADARRLERQASEDVLERTRVTCGTLTGFAHDVPAAARFDTLVVDEASQVLTPALILGLLVADRLVLAGDHRQLPPTVLSLEARALARTAFDALMSRDDAAGCRHMLTVQHRMNAALMDFPSDRFYAGKLSAHPSVAEHSLADLGFVDDGILVPDRPLDVIDTAGAGLDEHTDPDAISRENPGQARVVEHMVRGWVEAGLEPAKIGVITPYAAQVGRLQARLQDLGEAGLEIDSVDGFQGREKELIVFDAVRSNPDGEVGFLGDHRRLNVAITRARRKLILVGDSATLSSDPVWAAFFDAAMASGGYRSVFELPDLL
jgi:ATP-dependent RNA/DNA helicase IGHMBP2